MRPKVKQYFKESKALRTETVVNHTPDFAVGKKLENLDALKSHAFATNKRLLHFEKISQDCLAGYDVFEAMNQSVSAQGQWVSGLKFGDLRVMAVRYSPSSRPI